MRTERPTLSPRWAVRLTAAAFTIACLGVLHAQQTGDLGYTTRVSTALVARFAQQFGVAARERLVRWIGIAREQKNAVATRSGAAEATGRDAEILRSVNNFFNHVRFMEDRAHWGQDDYWSTPAEMVSSDGGDCEDYAIAKYYLLKELGIPVFKLRITYVKALKLNQAHMVLAYYRSIGAEPLILDNLDKRIQPASERTDLDPVYSFNDDEVELTKSGKKTVPSQLRTWLSLQRRLLEESRT